MNSREFFVWCGEFLVREPVVPNKCFNSKILTTTGTSASQRDKAGLSFISTGNVTSHSRTPNYSLLNPYTCSALSEKSVRLSCIPVGPRRMVSSSASSANPSYTDWRKRGSFPITKHNLSCNVLYKDTQAHTHTHTHTHLISCFRLISMNFLWLKLLTVSQTTIV
jgi:hypothetical protein